MCPDWSDSDPVEVLWLFVNSHGCFVAEALATREPSEDSRFQKLPAADCCFQLFLSLFGAVFVSFLIEG